MQKEEKYTVSLKQIASLVESEKSLIANLANICAVLKTTFDWWWVGFYLVGEEGLVLGPFQGPVACTRIDFGKGVCGTSWRSGKSILVDNVNDFPGHITCSAQSLSEIVVPVIKEGRVEMVLDVDSENEAYFDETDRKNLESLCDLVSTLI